MSNFLDQKFNGYVSSVLYNGHLQITFPNHQLFIIGIVDDIKGEKPNIEDLIKLENCYIEFNIKSQVALVSYGIKILKINTKN